MTSAGAIKGSKDSWDKIIDAKKKGMSFSPKRLLRYKDLVFLFVRRNLIINYKQTVLGPLWFVIQPIVSTIMYMFIFGSLAQLGTNNIPQVLFYFSGTMIWSLFSNTLLQAANVFNENKAMFGKVYFPRLIVPIAGALGTIIKMLMQFILFAIIYVRYCMVGFQIMFTWMFFLFPLIIVWIVLLALNIGLIITSITIKYRDLALMLAYIVSLWMYATPVVYPMSEIPLSLEGIIILNPVSVPMELGRICLFGVGNVTTMQVVISIIELVIVCILGIYLFNKNEKAFVDFV